MLVEIVMWLLYLCETSEMQQKHFYAIVKAQDFSMFPAETSGRAQTESLLIGQCLKIDILGCAFMCFPDTG